MMSQKQDLESMWLEGLYGRMREAYSREGPREEAARAAIQIYEENMSTVKTVRDTLARLDDFYNLLVESLRELEEARKRREKDTVTVRGKGSLVVKLVPCGKRCAGCPHGPYAYEVRRVNGKQVWKYLGKA